MAELCTLGMEVETERKENEDMTSAIKELMTEVETYRQAIQDAKDALASAEQELDEVLAREYENQ